MSVITLKNKNSFSKDVEYRYEGGDRRQEKPVLNFMGVNKINSGNLSFFKKVKYQQVNPIRSNKYNF